MATTLITDLNQKEMRVLYRGDFVYFTANFMESGNPVVPSDGTAFPSFAIYDPTGATIATGVGTDVGAGDWRASWNVQLGAKTGDGKIIWTMLSTTGRVFSYTERFTIREQNNQIDIEDDPGSFIFWPNMGDRVSFLADGPVQNMTMTMLVANGGAGIPMATYTEQTQLLSPGNPDIKSEGIGSKVMYYIDLPGYGMGEWLLLWSWKNSATGPTMRKVKQLYVPGTLFWELHPSLADVMDRVQKNAKATPFGYFEEDLYLYLKMGFGVLNRFKPMTQWSINDPTYPRAYDHYLIEAAAFWAFKSREVGAGELAFNYSGQEVTLDVDRSSIYAQQCQAFLDDINNFFKPDKVNWYRHTYTPVRLGIRLGLGASAVLGGGDMLGGMTSPYIRGFSRARRKGSW